MTRIFTLQDNRDVDEGSEERYAGDDPHFFAHSIMACVEGCFVGQPAKIKISSGVVLYGESDGGPR